MEVKALIFIIIPSFEYESNKYFEIKRIQFDHQARWENETMGWGSTGDPLSNLELDFASKEDAELYCQRMGIDLNWIASNICALLHLIDF